MTAALFVAAIAALAFAGLVLLAIPYVRSLDGAACASIGFAGGIVIVAVLMFATSVIHVRWSRALLVGSLLPFAIVGIVILMRRGFGTAQPRRTWIPFAIVILI